MATMEACTGNAVKSTSAAGIEAAESKKNDGMLQELTAGRHHGMFRKFGMITINQWYDRVPEDAPNGMSEQFRCHQCKWNGSIGSTTSDEKPRSGCAKMIAEKRQSTINRRWIRGERKLGNHDGSHRRYKNCRSATG